MAIKKYTNGSWVSASYRKYGTETDAITTLPATVIGDGTPISSYIIKGNMEQSGIPTPSSPIYPSECGERTENLFDVEEITHNGHSKNNFYGQVSSNNICAVIKRFEPNTDYCITWEFSSTSEEGVYNQMRLYATSTLIGYLNNGVVINLTQEQIDSITNVIAYFGSYNTDGYYKNFTIVQASIAPTSYIPYGYKLPLTLGSATTNIYLGEVQSTRRIKKLVLTGEEIINGMADANDGAKAVSYTYSALGMADIINNERNMNDIPYPIYLSSHFKEKTSGYSSWFNINAGEIGANNALPYAINRYLVFGTSEQTQANFKAYLAAQYAAGTPVTVWYVLAEPETAVVNEPIRKIGDYVDSVSGTGLATSGTAQEFDVGTALKPSEADLTYHGWHEHEDTKFTT